MAATVNFSGQAMQKSMLSKTMTGICISMPFKETCQVQLRKTRLHAISTKRRERKKLFVISSMSNSRSRSSPPSVSDTITQFYSCINEKNLKQLDKFISDDCCFDDCSFPKPFEGKKEVMQFFEQLTASMGQNVRFSLGHICEGDDQTAGVDWHLEWKKTWIPFTRGCSFFECYRKEGRFIIMKAQVMIESPIKPGSFALALFKTVTSLFDEFPRVAEWFLLSPHVVLHWMLKTYKIFLRPFIIPLLAGYIKLWNFMARLVTYTLNILLLIYKVSFK